MSSSHTMAQAVKNSNEDSEDLTATAAAAAEDSSTTILITTPSSSRRQNGTVISSTTGVGSSIDNSSSLAGGGLFIDTGGASSGSSNILITTPSRQNGTLSSSSIAAGSFSSNNNGDTSSSSNNHGDTCTPINLNETGNDGLAKGLDSGTFHHIMNLGDYHGLEDIKCTQLIDSFDAAQGLPSWPPPLSEGISSSPPPLRPPPKVGPLPPLRPPPKAAAPPPPPKAGPSLPKAKLKAPPPPPPPPKATNATKPKKKKQQKKAKASSPNIRHITIKKLDNTLEPLIQLQGDKAPTSPTSLVVNLMIAATKVCEFADKMPLSNWTEPKRQAGMMAEINKTFPSNIQVKTEVLINVLYEDQKKVGHYRADMVFTIPPPDNNKKPSNPTNFVVENKKRNHFTLADYEQLANMMICLEAQQGVLINLKPRYPTGAPKIFEIEMFKDYFTYTAVKRDLKDGEIIHLVLLQIVKPLPTHIREKFAKHHIVEKHSVPKGYSKHTGTIFRTPTTVNNSNNNKNIGVASGCQNSVAGNYIPGKKVHVAKKTINHYHYSEDGPPAAAASRKRKKASYATNIAESSESEYEEPTVPAKPPKRQKRGGAALKRAQPSDSDLDSHSGKPLSQRSPGTKEKRRINQIKRRQLKKQENERLKRQQEEEEVLKVITARGNRIKEYFMSRMMDDDLTEKERKQASKLYKAANANDEEFRSFIRAGKYDQGDDKDFEPALAAKKFAKLQTLLNPDNKKSG